MLQSNMCQAIRIHIVTSKNKDETPMDVPNSIDIQICWLQLIYRACCRELPSGLPQRNLIYKAPRPDESPQDQEPSKTLPSPQTYACCRYRACCRELPSEKMQWIPDVDYVIKPYFNDTNPVPWLARINLHARQLIETNEFGQEISALLPYSFPRPHQANSQQP